MTEQAVMAEHFRQAEASSLLSGLNSSGDDLYQAIKARVISGEIDIDEPMRPTVEHFKVRSSNGVATAIQLV